MQHDVLVLLVSAKFKLHLLNSPRSCCSRKCFLGPGRHLHQNAKIPVEQLILSVNSERAKPLKHDLDHNVHPKLFPLFLFTEIKVQSMTFYPWDPMDSDVLCRCSMYGCRRPKCVGTHTCGIIKKKPRPVFSAE